VNRSYRSAQQGRSRGIGFWIVSLLVIIGAIAAMVLVAQFVFGGAGGTRVQVPNLDGLTVEQAAGSLEEFGLRLGAQTPEVSERPEGRIIAQQPAAGETLEQGQAVNVTISSGLERATVPQLIGLTSIDAVRTALEDAGLELGNIRKVDSPQPAEYVLAQDPPEGIQVTAGSRVAITISTGLLSVPDLVGASEAQAKTDLVQLGFVPEVLYQESMDATAGTVIAQSPQPGAGLDRGATVVITVSTAPPPPTPEPEPSFEPVPSAPPVSSAPTVEPAPTA
jgi:serine/threonine-protein kinase